MNSVSVISFCSVTCIVVYIATDLGLDSQGIKS